MIVSTTGLIVVIAASAGNLRPLRRIFAALPADSTASVFVVMHTGHHSSVLPTILGWASKLPAAIVQDSGIIETGRIYLAPPNHRVLLEPGLMRLSRGPKAGDFLPVADPLFISAAIAYRERVMGIVLSAGVGDGAFGLRVIAAYGGLSVMKQPKTAAAVSMPYAALLQDHPDACLSVEAIARRAAAFCLHGSTLPPRMYH